MNLEDTRPFKSILHNWFYSHFQYSSRGNNECSVVKSHVSVYTAITSVSDRIYE